MKRSFLFLSYLVAGFTRSRPCSSYREKDYAKAADLFAELLQSLREIAASNRILAEMNLLPARENRYSQIDLRCHTCNFKHS